MKLKMQNEHESTLEYFMQNSFGAPFFYLPKKLKTGINGKNEREAADLTWVNDNFVVLFYMTKSKKTISSNIKHNLSQAKRFRQLWKTGEERFDLKGVNRFGDTCHSKYDCVDKIIYLSVVSNECGIKALDQQDWNDKEIYLNIPDALLGWLAEFGGTIVDLLNIILQFFLTYKNNLFYSDSFLFNDLKNFTQQYYLHSTQSTAIQPYNLSVMQDAHIMHKILERMKIPFSFGNAIKDNNGRFKISRIFSDLMFVEYAAITSVAAAVISASDPPEFKKWCVAKTPNTYYKFIIASINLGAEKGSIAATEAATNAATNEKGKLDGVVLFYGDMGGLNDYRYPIMTLLPEPEDLPIPHSVFLYNEIRGIFKMLV